MSQIQQIKEATDIVQIVGEKLQLQRSGSNWRGLCPFHNEKTPSFFVSEGMQRFKCFGCGKSGDVFTFLEEYDHLTFFESLELLAKRAGIELEKRNLAEDDQRRARQFGVLRQAADYYHYLLTEHKAGERARRYLKDRAITDASVRLFGLGYALPAWDGLATYLIKKKKQPARLVEEVGLIVKGRGGREYDRFRDRIIFPLKDHLGRVVGFSGRLLDSQAKEAKYINSPETALYHKSKLLYGWSELKDQIKKAGEVLITEGEIDVISSAQVDVNHVLAIKGSALTEDHAKLLKRLVPRVILALDPDEAGVEATRRAIKVLESVDLELRVARLPKGQDPDDLARRDPSAWRNLVKQHQSAYQFLIDHALEKMGGQTPRSQKQILKSLAPSLMNIESSVERTHYVRYLAKQLNVKPSLVETDLARFQQQSPVTSVKASSTETKTHQPESRQERLARYSVFLLMRSNGEARQARSQELLPLLEFLPNLQAIIKWLAEVDTQADLKDSLAGLAADQQELLFTISLDPEFTQLAEKIRLTNEWKKTINELRNLVQMNKRKAITAELATLDAKAQKTNQEEEREAELLRQLAELKA